MLDTRISRESGRTFRRDCLPTRLPPRARLAARAATSRLGTAPAAPFSSRRGNRRVVRIVRGAERRDQPVFQLHEQSDGVLAELDPVILRERAPPDVRLKRLPRRARRKRRLILRPAAAPSSGSGDLWMPEVARSWSSATRARHRRTSTPSAAIAAKTCAPVTATDAERPDSDSIRGSA